MARWYSDIRALDKLLKSTLAHVIFSLNHQMYHQTFIFWIFFQQVYLHSKLLSLIKIITQNPISKSELHNCDVSLDYGYDKLNDSE